MSNAGVLNRITSAMDQAGIAYMLTGSFASAFYGSPRASQDIDFVIEADADQLHALARLFPADQYYFDLQAAMSALQHRSMFNVLDMLTGWKIDFIFRKDRAFSREEFQRRKPITLEGVPVYAASPEDVVISKLEWARKASSQRHIVDAAGVLGNRAASLDSTYLQKWVAELGLFNEWETARSAARMDESGADDRT
jgi:nucleotidyltransferase AbiEii toxin of type IV toxin-antitoxin system